MNKITIRRLSLAGVTALAVLVRTVPAQEAAPDVDTIVARHLEAMGGVEAHRKLKTRRSEGTVTIKAIGTPWSFVSIQKAPDRKHNRFEIPMMGTVTEGCDGEVAWKEDPGQVPRQLEGRELAEKLRDARFHDLLEMMTDAEFAYLGEEEHEGRACHALRNAEGKDNPAAASAYTVYIDAETYLIGRIKFSAGAGAAAGGVSVLLDDYRPVDGVQLPFAATIALGEMQFLSIDVEAIVHGVPVDDALFAMPPNVKRAGAVSGAGGRVFSDGGVRVAVEMVVDDFDTNGDGTLEEAETEREFLALQKRMEDCRDTLLSLFDANKDGALDTAEKQALNDFVAGLAGMLLSDGDGNWQVDESELDRAWETVIEQVERDR